MDNAFEDNVFCTAILQILKMPAVLSDSPTDNLDEVKFDFEKNGVRDEAFYDCGLYSPSGIIKRNPLTSIQPKAKTLSKRAQKFAKTQKNGFCRFCENNNEPAQVYHSHSLRDHTGKLTCPRLRKYVCPICGASGDSAHTVRYCTKKPIFTIRGGETTDISKVHPITLFKTAIRV